MSRNVSPIAALSLSFALCGAPGASAQNGWVNHADPSGFHVQLPAGWRAEPARAGRVVIQDPTRTSFVVAEPFLLPAGARAAQSLGPVVQRLAGLIPNASIQGVRQLPADDDEAVAQIAFG